MNSLFENNGVVSRTSSFFLGNIFLHPLKTETSLIILQLKLSMACFVSLSFSVPPCSFHNPFKGRYPKQSAFCRLPGLATIKTASYFLAPCSSNKGIFSVSSEHYLTTLSKHFDEIVPCSLNVSSCTRMVIMGYWVGPDIDDGWGFLEASICPSE